MKKIKLLSFYSSEVSRLEKTDIKNDFFISIVLELGRSYKEGIDIYWFFLADIEGVTRYLKNELKYEKSVSLEKIVIIEEYDYEFIIKYLKENIEEKLEELSEEEFWKYIACNYECED